MFYGYYSIPKDKEFAEALCKEFGYPLGYLPGRLPYIEVGGATSGVSIRRITHLPYAEQQIIATTADEIFLKFKE